MFANKKLAYVIAGVFVALVSLIPFLQVAVEYGGMPEIYPIFEDIDHNYYYARIREVLDGHPMLGNPFYIEHIDNFALAFSSAEWILAIPTLLGFSFVSGLFLNNILWALIFFVTLSVVFRNVGIEWRRSLFVALLVFLAMTQLIIRPVAMQIVFPFFLFFVLMFFRWIQTPDRKNSTLLVYAAASNFYIYSFSWQIIAVALVAICGYFIVTKDKGGTWNSFVVGLGTIVLSLPVLVFTAIQTQNPLYWESALRTAMAITRIPSSAVLVYGGPLVIATTLFYLVNKSKKKSVTIFIYTLVVSVFVASMSNVITAKDPEVASHVGRYMTLLSYIIFAISLTEIDFAAYTKFKKILIVALVSLLTLFSLREITMSLTSLQYGIAGSVKAQAYAKPLQWIENNIENRSVILANQDITGYIPVLTKHYIVFSVFGGNHLLTNEEQVDRYILSKFNISEITEGTLREELRIFAGTGPAIHQYKSVNRRVRICRALHLEAVGYSCGDYMDALSLLGADYLPGIVGRAKTINTELAQWYDRFGVSYLIIDTKKDPKYAALSLFTRKIYDDGRFEIWAR